MNLSQIIDVLPLQVYARRGALVIHFSSPADLIVRLAETTAALSDLDRQADAPRTEVKTDRAGRRGIGRTAMNAGARSEADSDGTSATDPESPGHNG